MLSAEELQKILKLQPLPVEGGYFAVTYRSDITLARQSLPSGYSGERALAIICSPRILSRRCTGSEGTRSITFTWATQ
jgi:hypothetical protein